MSENRSSPAAAWSENRPEATAAMWKEENFTARMEWKRSEEKNEGMAYRYQVLMLPRWLFESLNPFQRFQRLRLCRCLMRCRAFLECFHSCGSIRVRVWEQLNGWLIHQCALRELDLPIFGVSFSRDPTFARIANARNCRVCRSALRCRVLLPMQSPFSRNVRHRGSYKWLRFDGSTDPARKLMKEAKPQCRNFNLPIPDPSQSVDAAFHASLW